MAFQFRDPQLETSGEVVGFYPREYFFLDNFSAFQVDYLDRRWPTAEQAYHATKFLVTLPAVVEELHRAMSPHDALKIAHINKEHVPDDWDDRKVSVMEEICRLKRDQHPYIRRKLREIPPGLLIVEDSPKDDFWGWGPDRDGRNELGKIWMRLRDELKTAA